MLSPLLNPNIEDPSIRTLAFEAFIFERSGIYIFFNLLKSDSFPIEEGQMRMLRMTIASATAFLNTRLLIILKFLIVFEIFNLNNEHSFIERARRAARARAQNFKRVS